MRQDLKYKLDTLLQLLQKEEFKITYQTKNVVHFSFTEIKMFIFNVIFRYCLGNRS